MSKPDWEYRHERMGQQSVYKALMAWKVDFDLAYGTELRTPNMKARGTGHADMLIQAAMLAYGEESEQAEVRVAEDYAEMIASRA